MSNILVLKLKVGVNMKKNKNLKRIMSVFLSMVLVVSFTLSGFGSSEVNAAKKAKLSKTKVTITVGGKVKLKVKNVPKKAKITYKTNKKKVAKVTKKGIIKGLKKGKAVITVTIKYKKNKKNIKKILKCKVTVKAKKKSSGTNSKTNKTEQQKQETTESGNTGKNQPSDSTKKYDAGEYSITKIHSGEGTFYDRESTGAANLDDYESVYLTAAMNNEDYMNGLAGAYIEVTDKDGDKVKVLITDRLPEGKKGDIDLSRKAFKTIEPEKTGRMKITWKIIPLPTDKPVSFLWKPTSTKYWAEVQVRNGRYPIKSVEYYDKSAKRYVALERQEYNYFKAEKGMGEGPYTFKITDIYGHVITEKNVSIDTTGTPVNGSSNLPY